MKARDPQNHLKFLLTRKVSKPWWLTSKEESVNSIKDQDSSKEVESHKEYEEEDLGDHHIIFYEHNDLNIWVGIDQQNNESNMSIYLRSLWSFGYFSLFFICNFLVC